MRVLLLEESADGLLDLAIRAQALGHQCRYHLGSYDQQKQPVGRGLVERVPDWRASMRWADLVVTGGNGKWLKEIDRWREMGVPVIGGCADTASWELDRLKGMRLFERAKIPVPRYRHCANLREAAAYVATLDDGCAVKPCGAIADKTTSCVGKSPKEILWRLDRWQREGKSFPEGLIVQDRIQGVEFAVGGWIGPDGFAPGWEENFEEKRMFAGGIGPNTGEMGTVMRLVKESKLAKKVLAPFEDALVASGFVGNVDVNCIVDEYGDPWPLEWTCRCGWPATNIELALHADPVEFLAGVLSGKPPRTRRLDQIAVGVVLALPPFPFPHEKHQEVVGVPIWGVTDGTLDALHLCMAQEGKDDYRYATAGSYVLVSTGVAETVTAARAKALRVIDRLALPASPYWRHDIGSRLRSGLDSLQEHGYATGLRYA